MKYLLTLVILSAFSNVFGQTSANKWKDVNYAGNKEIYHNLDIILPEVEKPKYPVVIAVYGSAWFSNNSKESVLHTIGKPLLDAGYALIAPNHRSSNDAKFPAQINDIKAVVRFLRANAKSYNLDTSFIAITGFSSGGHLAALTGTSGAVGTFTIGEATADIEGNVGEHLSFSSSVDAVVDWFGPTDFLTMDSCGSTMTHNAANSPESNLVGGAIQENKDKCALANPVTYVDKDDPPFLILHGDKDPLVPFCQSEVLYESIQKAGVESEFILVPDAKHGPGLFEEKYYKKMVDFLNDKNNIK